MTLTLDGGAYARSRIDIGRALNVSGVPGVAVDWSDVDRLSDTEIRIELGFNGDIDADATLTFSVGSRRHRGIRRCRAHDDTTGRRVHGIGSRLDSVTVNGTDTKWERRDSHAEWESLRGVCL